jgi:hypothetical protein
MIQSEQSTNVLLLVSCNKQDIEQCMNAPEIKRTFNRSTAKIGVRDCMVLAYSAFSDDGIDGSLNWMKDCIVRNSTKRPPKRQDIA